MIPNKTHNKVITHTKKTLITSKSNRVYVVTLKSVNMGSPAYLPNLNHWNAYVDLPFVTAICGMGDIGNETYRDGDTVGVDTAHYNNMHMNFDEKEKDAIEQITGVIESYEKKMLGSTIRFEKKSPIINTRACVRARTSHDGENAYGIYSHSLVK